MFGAGAFALSACGGTSGGGGGTKAGAFVWESSAAPTLLNPIGPTNSPQVKRVVSWISSGLWRFGSNPGEFVAQLATENPPERISDKVFTVQLRDDVKWHDGSPFTAEDVQATFEAVLDEAYGSTYRNRVLALDSVRATSDYEVEFTLKTVDNFIVNEIAPIPIVKASQARSVDDLNSKPLGTGPYMIESYTSGESIVLVANPHYYEDGVPATEKLTYNVVPNDGTRTIDLINGTATFTSDVSPGDVELLEREGVTVHVQSSAPTRHYFYINTTKPELGDKLFRQALAFAINRKQIVDTVWRGYADIGQTSTSPKSVYYDTSLAPYGEEPDLDKARSLLAQAKKPSKPIVLTMLQGSQYAAAGTILVENWAELGVDVVLEQLDAGAASEKLRGKTYDMWMLIDYLGTGPGYMPSAIADYSSAGSLFSGFTTPEVDAAIETARTATTDEELQEAMKYLLEVDIDQACQIAMCYPHYLEAQGAKLNDYEPSALGNVPYGVPLASFA
ncbi:ABC transporter substrate-binding protein [Nocardioides bigeumensis]|uniref:ABC transporter substrate-binding protein n=2 Tax=Nocardioides bigeumensis TaxID=433657 RepID=A0ABP5JTX6_9ACTN